MTLPPLPLSLFHERTTAYPPSHIVGGRDYEPMKLYTADQMRDYATAAVQAEREACAKMCVDYAMRTPSKLEQIASDNCAAAIRARTD